MFLSLDDLGMVNVFRYQPMPVGNPPSACVDGFFSSKAPSMLQSCGRLSCRHPESLNFGSRASESSPGKNFQFLSKLVVMRGWEKVWVAERRKSRNRRSEFLITVILPPKYSLRREIAPLSSPDAGDFGASGISILVNSRL